MTLASRHRRGICPLAWRPNPKGAGAGESIPLTAMGEKPWKRHNTLKRAKRANNSVKSRLARPAKDATSFNTSPELHLATCQKTNNPISCCNSCQKDHQPVFSKTSRPRILQVFSSRLKTVWPDSSRQFADSRFSRHAKTGLDLCPRSPGCPHSFWMLIWSPLASPSAL